MVDLSTIGIILSEDLKKVDTSEYKPFNLETNKILSQGNIIEFESGQRVLVVGSHVMIGPNRLRSTVRMIHGGTINPSALWKYKLYQIL